MKDDEAVVTMVDSNLQREQITPSVCPHCRRQLG